jgi:uncharacterized protein
MAVALDFPRFCRNNPIHTSLGRRARLFAGFPFVPLMATVLLCTRLSTSSPTAFLEDAQMQKQLSSSEISQLQTKAEAGDAAAQWQLARAYREGNGVAQNQQLALQWSRKAADQGCAEAENYMGVMYLMGEGVQQDKVAAVHWYANAAKHGNAKAMFNLGASYYNGEGVGENLYTAYAWFLLARDAGEPLADDAVKRSAASMSQKETADAFVQIAEKYAAGQVLPQSGEQTIRWLRKAAELDPHDRVLLAVELIKGPESPHKYDEPFRLCRAGSKSSPLAQNCLGYMYRKGLGVPQDSAEAVKWYKKAADNSNPGARLALAEMYVAGEGTKVDRAAAFVMVFRADAAGARVAKSKEIALFRELNQPELKQVESKLRERHFDPGKVFAAIEKASAP